MSAEADSGDEAAYAGGRAAAQGGAQAFVARPFSDRYSDLRRMTRQHLCRGRLEVASERMSGPDAAWLYMDRPENLMVVNTVLSFDTTPDWVAVEEALQGRLVERHSRFRQRVTKPPITLGLLAPTWDSAVTRARDHIVRAALPSPGDARALHRYVAEQARLPLDARRPLWVVHAIDGYGAGAALLLRTHHAIGDGRALVEVIAGLTEPLEARATAADQRPPRLRTVGERAGGVVADVQAFAKLTDRVIRWPAGGRSRLTGKKTMAWLAPISIGGLKEASAGCLGSHRRPSVWRAWVWNM